MHVGLEKNSRLWVQLERSTLGKHGDFGSVAPLSQVRDNAPKSARPWINMRPIPLLPWVNSCCVSLEESRAGMHQRVYKGKEGRATKQYLVG